MLTEAEVERSFHKLVARPEISSGDYKRAETLLENLRPESPLRHRLVAELDELRRLHPCKGRI